jgi:hypothetical protein
MVLPPKVLDARKFPGRFFRPPRRLLGVAGVAFSTLQAENGLATLPGIWRRDEGSGDVRTRRITSLTN